MGRHSKEPCGLFRWGLQPPRPPRAAHSARYRELGKLAPEALTTPEDPVWLPQKSTLREPPEEPFAADLDDAGLPVEDWSA